MDCQAASIRRARQAARFASLVMSVFVFLVVAASIVARAETPFADSVLKKAMDYQLQFRAGNLDVVPQYVALLEAATKTEPENADLWYALGRAHLMKGARAMLPGGNTADAMPAMQNGSAALRRALKINPDHAYTLAQLGGLQALMATMLNAPAMAKQGVAQMNRAVELAPDSTRVRLARAFLGLTLPDDLRNHETEGEDLDFIIDAAYGSRAADYVRILRADLDFETGKAQLAREGYELVADAGSPAAAQEAKSRLAALAKGGVTMADIQTLRSAAGSQCAMCHGGP